MALAFGWLALGRLALGVACFGVAQRFSAAIEVDL